MIMPIERDEKSYVGMARCFFCLEESQILLDTRLRDSLPRDCGVVNLEPCDKCRDYMERGVMLIGVTNDAECAQVQEDYEKWKATVKRDSQGNPVIPFIPNPERSGYMCVVRDDAIAKLVLNKEHQDFILSCRWTFVPMEVWEACGLPMSDEDIKEESDDEETC